MNVCKTRPDFSFSCVTVRQTFQLFSVHGELFQPSFYSVFFSQRTAETRKNLEDTVSSTFHFMRGLIGDTLVDVKESSASNAQLRRGYVEIRVI